MRVGLPMPKVMVGATAQRLFLTSSRAGLPLFWSSRFRRKAVPLSASMIRFQSAVARFWLPLHAVNNELKLLSRLAVLLTRLIEPVGEPRPLSVLAGPLST